RARIVDHARPGWSRPHDDRHAAREYASCRGVAGAGCVMESPMHDAQVATILFTDIEGSTRLWEQKPQQMSRALKHHDAISHAARPRRGAAQGSVVAGTPVPGAASASASGFPGAALPRGDAEQSAGAAHGVLRPRARACRGE